MAVDDLARLPLYNKYTAVYFWLGDVPVKDRPMFILTFAGWCHSLSREPSLAQFPQVVGTDNSLLRVDYNGYRWPFDVVQLLHKAHPYNTQELVVSNVPWHGGVWPGDGLHYPVGNFQYNRIVPLVGARWFLWQTMRNEGRTPNYNDFLGLKTREDINTLTGFNTEIQKKALRSDFIDVPRFSKIAQTYVRNVVIQPISGGWRYVTEDSEFSVGEKNAIRTPDRELAKHDAEEHIFPLPNGFPGYGLTDGAAAGKIQKSAPPFVGFDKSTVSNDARIEPVGCLRCHFRAVHGGSAGLIDFTPHFRKKLSTMQQNTPDYFKGVEFERLYLRPFQHQLIIDRALFSQAIGQATGMQADEWAYRVTTLFEEYDAGATLAETSAQLGCETGFVTGSLVRQAIQEYAYMAKQLDMVLGLYAEGEIIPRTLYHEVYPVLYTTLKEMQYAKTTSIPPVGLVPDAAAGDSRRFILQLPKHIQLSGGTSLLRPANLSTASNPAVLPSSNPNVQPKLRIPSGSDNKRAGNNVPKLIAGSPTPRPVSRGSNVAAGNAGAGSARTLDSRSQEDRGYPGSGVASSSTAAAIPPRPDSSALLRQVPHGSDSGKGLPDIRRAQSTNATRTGADRGYDLSVKHARPEVKDATWSKQTILPRVRPGDGGDGNTVGGRTTSATGPTNSPTTGYSFTSEGNQPCQRSGWFLKLLLMFAVGLLFDLVWWSPVCYGNRLDTDEMRIL